MTNGHTIVDTRAHQQSRAQSPAIESLGLFNVLIFSVSKGLWCH